MSSGILTVVPLHLELVLLHIILHVLVRVGTGRVLPPCASGVVCVTWCSIIIARKQVFVASLKSVVVLVDVHVVLEVEAATVLRCCSLYLPLALTLLLSPLGLDSRLVLPPEEVFIFE